MLTMQPTIDDRLSDERTERPKETQYVCVNTRQLDNLLPLSNLRQLSKLINKVTSPQHRHGVKRMHLLDVPADRQQLLGGSNCLEQRGPPPQKNAH